MRWSHGTIVRLTLLLVLAQVAALALGLTVVHRFTSATLLSDARTAAEVARDDLVDDYRQQGLPGLVEAIDYRLKARDDRNFIVLLKGPDGRRLTGNLRQWPSTVADTARWQRIQLYRSGATAPESLGVVTTRLPGGYALLTGEILDAERQLARASETAFLYALAVGIVIAALMAILVAWILARRIDVFSRAAHAFVGGKLDTRVERDETGDAFDRLAVSINAMFGRIAGLVRELRMVTDSMAHDLRSPVSRLKARLEQGLGRTDEPAAQAAIADAIEEADSLHRLLDTALEISRAEAGIGRDQFTRFALRPMLDDLAEVYGPLAEDRGFTIAVDAPSELAIFAHRELLVRALSNLVDNALKYAAGGSAIRIDAQDIGGNRITLTASDDGAGLSERERADAARRFVRLDPARGGAGAGLGLSLVETIAHLHGGTMHLGPNPPHGLRVRLTLPVVS
ncbi:signal transduction histidine kinase [Sphingopyxis panaciterrae]|uniref:sensor histidine kinase n=1 Tax=Sphingopyxis panaciterrae TaxID=363841 RepID=UPI001421D1C5|nr:HAMP domain-containing sensor histidine kinase [Sphingopyxis panaciterrae]NIJ35914.1 signal transduction histidine kinase [Sphingopyxis panaciterrae]